MSARPQPFDSGRLEDALRTQRRAAARSVCINGRFLTQRASGVQRFAGELVKALDAELARGHGSHIAEHWQLLVPPGVEELPALQCIRVRQVGRGGGHVWDQLLRWHCGRNDLLVNLTNGGPVLRGCSLSVIHDAAVYRTPLNFTRGYRSFHQLLGRLLALRSHIATVSHFSRQELSEVLSIPAGRIAVVPNGSEHLRGVDPDASVLQELRLQPQRFFLFIGSPVPNKNLSTAMAAFARLGVPDVCFVLVGAVDAAVFGQGLQLVPPGVVIAGRLSDAQIAALLCHARALVFPSLYEGFGIPPLEAMLHRCPVIASDIPPVREVCGDAVLYFDPSNADALCRRMRQALDETALLQLLVERGEQRVAMFSWQRSAQRLLEALAAMG
ncbi:glycosyltransferase family 4 protein [Azohydromonas caseinilytica]|uniref:Glycosyltransferase family 4 protein n=1 Tax=Azohydromonas caseinilytica TaxID=2728836 RepID=A0A848FIV5_9BURK|nr:glycosyltransferase family 1 protein [Azohydromonas caseinilytica]NML17771.1 glycosyltransferase family 4 protein [Azohydromonas caseinilytica]